jgi:putative endonuclease
LDAFYIYVLVSLSAGRRYVGMSSNPERRLIEHNAGKNRSTKAYSPWKIVYTESFPTLLEARKREVFLKTGNGRAFLNKKLAGVLSEGSSNIDSPAC